MTSQRKNLLTYFLVFLGLMLTVTAVNYWSTTAAVNATVSGYTESNLNNIVAELDHRLQESEGELTRLSLLTSLQEYAVRRQTEPPRQDTLTRKTSRSSDDLSELSEDIRVGFASTLNSQYHWQLLTLYSGKGKMPLLQAERNNTAPAPAVVFRQGTFNPSEFDNDVLFSRQSSLRMSGPTLVCTVPIFGPGAQSVVALLAGRANFSEIFSDVASALAQQATSAANPGTMIVAVDGKGMILYHSNHVLQGQMVANATPEFIPLVVVANSKQGDSRTFRLPTGQEFTTEFAPLPSLGIGVALGKNTSAIRSITRTWLWVNLGLSGLIAIIGALLLERHTQKKSEGMARVTEELSAIAKGELDRRIELKSSDDARGIADNINMVTERLRAQIAREAESRQFESFVRLSAMLTHDLKNAIEALSLTVGNMERHFDNEQFRADAMKSVAGATDKLKAVVARLSRPLTSFSGEHKRPVKVDLVPLLKHAGAVTARAAAQKHEIKFDLPDTLEAWLIAERIEGVIENLVINALEAMGTRRGTLTIEAAKRDEKWATFSISDTGPGMSSNFIEQKLFRPFSTTKQKGIGLGLYTCRETVQACGGWIEVESTEGAGTTFRVVLPSASFDGRD